MMTIAYISSERYPHHNTNTQQIIKNVSSLRAAGVNIDLILPRQARMYFASNAGLEAAICKYYNVPPGLGIRQTGLFPATRLQLDKYFHPIFAIFYCRFIKGYDIIYTRNIFTAILLALFGLRFMFETYQRLGDTKPRFIKLLTKQAKKGRMLGMVLHSNVAAESMRGAGFPSEKLLVLHNGVDNSDMLPVLTKNEARRKLKLDLNARYVVYTGNMQKNKCVEVVVDIAAFTPEINYLLVGAKPDDIIRLNAYCEAKNVKNVMLMERKPVNEVSQYLYAADALIIPPAAAPMQSFGKTVLPFKLFPYLAAGRPIIAPDQADMRELLRSNENGLLVPPDAAEQNAAAIRALFSDENRMEKLAANATETSRSLNWEARAQRFKSWLNTI
ncbi:MAG: glycosyltransferase [Saprospiraceae bacterium]|nr:glycosyltransferase [Saprospiraceae bacterium]